MSNYIPVRKSQFSFYRELPLYYQSDEGEFILYKKKGEVFEEKRLQEEKFPDLYIKAEDREDALKELQKSLNLDLARKLVAKGVTSIKHSLCNIVHEALAGPLDKSLDPLPETVEILFRGAGGDAGFLEALSRISDHSRRFVDHAANVASLIMVYGLHTDMPENKVKELGLASLLHDIGVTEIDPDILEKDDRLSDEDFQKYREHPAKGHDMIKLNTTFDPVIARIILEHHETIDGNGYPRGIASISPEAQLIGLIDSYEPLVYQKKAHRPQRKPFEALQLIKKEVLAGKYDKNNFKTLCACLLK